MSELDLCVGELRNAAQSLTAVADGLTALFSGGNRNDAPNAPKIEPPKPVALEEVRAKLADISRSGKTDAVRELLSKYGADRLSAVDPARFADLLKDAEGLT
jgi:hypothetical protein